MNDIANYLISSNKNPILEFLFFSFSCCTILVIFIKSTINVLFLLVVICIAVFGNAQLPQFPLLFPIPLIPRLPGTPDITKCLSTMMNIPGCVAEISQSIMTHKFGNIGPACCKDFLEAEANCTKKSSFQSFSSSTVKGTLCPSCQSTKLTVGLERSCVIFYFQSEIILLNYRKTKT
ncbi:hypothetical protein Bca101_010359 [Brassica carinata]